MNPGPIRVLENWACSEPESLENVATNFAAAALDEYGERENVVFVALDLDTFGRVRADYDEVMKAGNAFDGAQAGQDLADSVRELFGFGA